MKTRYLAAILIITVCASVLAETPAFEGLEKAMDPSTYERAGLNKLSRDERSALDEFIRNYVAGKQKDAAAVAAAQAVDRAVKERKVQPPEIIESRIVGTYKGYNPKTFFYLANGQTWRPTNDDVVTNSAVENPSIIIYRDMFGYKMFIEGASVVRVKRVR